MMMWAQLSAASDDNVVVGGGGGGSVPKCCRNLHFEDHCYFSRDSTVCDLLTAVGHALISLCFIESNPCIILDKQALVIIFKIVFRTRLRLVKLDGVALDFFLPFCVPGPLITFLNFFCAGHILLFQHNCCNTFSKPLFAVVCATGFSL
jgi:hypothetical protein